MSDNGDLQRAIRILQARDRESLENLVIAYFPNAGVVTINGYTVTRSQSLKTEHRKPCFVGLFMTNKSPSKQRS